MKIILSIMVLIGFMLIPAPPTKAASRWVQSTSISGANIMGIASYELDQGWAVSGNLSGRIYAFDGSNWTLQTETGTPLQAIDSYQDDQIYAVGSSSGNGRIFYNEGSGWDLQTEIIDSGTLYDIFDGSSSRIYAVGDNGIIWRNYGFGSWSIFTSTGDNSWNAVDGIDQDNFWVAGYSGCGFSKIMNWHVTPYAWTVMTEVNLGGNNQLRDLAVVSPPNLWACGDDGIIMHYDGTAWSIFTDLGSANIYAITAYPQEAESVRAASSDGKIYGFNGSKWVLQTDLGPTPIRSLDTSTKAGGWAAAGESILKSIPVRRIFD